MRYIVGLLLGIGLIVLTFILIFRAFSGDGERPERIDLMSYATTDAVVRIMIDGPIVADQEHDRVRITVSNDQILFEQIKGYEGRLVQSKTYESNTQAFSTLLRALDLAGYTRGNPEGDKDERGYCPRGSRFVYEALDGGDTILRWWSTSCSDREGNFVGSADTVRTLFRRQVPDYNQLTRGLNL